MARSWAPECNLNVGESDAASSRDVYLHRRRSAESRWAPIGSDRCRTRHPEAVAQRGHDSITQLDVVGVFIAGRSEAIHHQPYVRMHHVQRRRKISFAGIALHAQ